MTARCAMGILSLLVGSVGSALAASPLNLEGVTVHLFLEAPSQTLSDLAGQGPAYCRRADTERLGHGTKGPPPAIEEFVGAANINRSPWPPIEVWAA
jgi:hypothetical protein